MRRWFLIALLVTTACSGGEPAAPSAPPAVDPLLDTARREGTVAVVVDLAVEREPDGTWDARKVVMAQRALLAELGRGVTITARYETSPRLALELTERALKKLRASPVVAAIHLDE
ncbi:MAG: hypothetical protein ABR613_13190 [Actinomycetota bacterium]